MYEKVMEIFSNEIFAKLCTMSANITIKTFISVLKILKNNALKLFTQASFILTKSFQACALVKLLTGYF